MQENDLKRIAEKIAKCLALAESANAHEAEIARGQAQKLMEKYNLSITDVDAGAVRRFDSKVPGKHKPALYISQLAGLVSEAFGCKTVLRSGGGVVGASIAFIGVAQKPELAGYIFDVLRRKLTKDRAEYAGTLSRFKRENKTRKLDAFCYGWLYRIHQQIADFAGSEREAAAIDAYIQQHWGDQLKTDGRNTKPIKGKDADAACKGFAAAEKASLHKPMQTQPKAAIADQRQTELF